MVEDKFLAELKSALDYNPETGEFHWKVSVNRRIRVGSKAGSSRVDGRLQIRFQGKIYLAHRLAWLLTYEKWPDQVIDHIDGNPSNNRMDNLRDVSELVNQQNQRKASINNKTGFLGVSWSKSERKFRVNIRTSTGNKHLGYFTSAEEAHAAYLAAKRILHEGCTI